MNIEFINRVELQGIIGSVRQYTIGTQKGFQLTVATNRVYKDKDGNPVIETQWTSCTGWESENIDLSLLEKGREIHLIGRIRNQRYTGTDGVERTTMEVVVSSLEAVS